MQSTYFPDIVGQTEVVRQLSFYIDGHNYTRLFPSTLITGMRGSGKTTIATGVSMNLKRATEDKHKKVVSICGAEFQKSAALKNFVDGVIIPHIGGTREVTLFFDEIHQADHTVLNWLLPVLNPNADHCTVATYGGVDYTFDFRYFTFLSATTNPERLSKPLLDRMKRIDLAPYSDHDLIQILVRYAEGITFESGVEQAIVSCMRGSPRNLVSFATNDIPLYLGKENKTTFNMNDWEHLRKIINLKPLGLRLTEIEILRFLDHVGPSSLTQIAAKLGLEATTVRRNYETFLLARNLIKIDGKRHITPAGQSALKNLT